jgi:hypothetical protein
VSSREAGDGGRSAAGTIFTAGSAITFAIPHGLSMFVRQCPDIRVASASDGITFRHAG